MAPQSPALRAVVKQLHGVAGSAAVTKPLAIIGEGNVTWATRDDPKGDAIMVFVVDTEKRPLSPCHPARARRLLTRGKAAV